MIGLSGQGMGTLATTKLLSNWFIKHRGLAMGLSATGLSLSGMLMPILAAWLINMVGWKISYLIIGLGLFVIVSPVAAYFIFNQPADMGLHADFNKTTSKRDSIDKKAVETDSALSSQEIFRNSLFWKIVFIVGIPAGILVAIITHTVPYVTDFGISNLDAATILSMIAVVAIFSKAGWGWLVDHFESRFAIFLSLVIQTVGIILFLYGDTYWKLYFAACVYGLGMGSIPPFQGVLVAKAFGRRSFGKVFGYTIPAMLPFTLGLIYLSATIYDHFGSYEIAFYLFISLYGLAALIASQLKLPNH
jgi:sugar phosphate permease